MLESNLCQRNVQPVKYLILIFPPKNSFTWCEELRFLWNWWLCCLFEGHQVELWIYLKILLLSRSTVSHQFFSSICTHLMTRCHTTWPGSFLIQHVQTFRSPDSSRVLEELFGLYSYESCLSLEISGFATDSIWLEKLTWSGEVDFCCSAEATKLDFGKPRLVFALTKAFQYASRVLCSRIRGFRSHQWFLHFFSKREPHPKNLEFR